MSIFAFSYAIVGLAFWISTLVPTSQLANNVRNQNK